MYTLETLIALVDGISTDLLKKLKDGWLDTYVKKDGVIYQMMERIDVFVGEYWTRKFVVGNLTPVANFVAITSVERLDSGIYFGVVPRVCDLFDNIQEIQRMVREDIRDREWYNGRVGALS